jgi:VRR-NUC domain
MPYPSEADEQAAVIEWAELQMPRYPDLALLFAVPNGARVAWNTARQLKRTGLKAGVPDLCLPVPRHGYAGLWIELKRAKGGSLSSCQAEWHARLRLHGHRVDICKGAAAAIAVLTDYCQSEGRHKAK